MTTLSFFLMLMLVAVILFLYRNNRVYEVRIAILYTQGFKGFELHEALPSYDDMLLNPRYWHMWKEGEWRDWLEQKGIAK